jgi:hypothetical protein
MDDRGIEVRFPAEARDCSLLHSVKTDYGAHPASYQWVLGTLSPAEKQPGREADHSPLSSAEVKNSWSYTSTSWRGAYLSTGIAIVLTLTYLITKLHYRLTHKFLTMANINITVFWDVTSCSLVGGFVGTTSTRLRGVTSQKTAMLTFIASRTSNHK